MSMIWAPLRARPKARQVSAAAYTSEVGKLGEGDKTGGDRRRRHRARQSPEPFRLDVDSAGLYGTAVGRAPRG
jgi:hypothetical protein